MKRHFWGVGTGIVLLFGLLAVLPKAVGRFVVQEAALAAQEAVRYANDLGLSEIQVVSYPKTTRSIYPLLAAKCSKCHSLSRILNAPYAEPNGKDFAEKKKRAEALRKSNPDLFSDKNVWQIGPDVWETQIKRMMVKPGAGISRSEGRQILEFLVYDSNRRKLGKDKKEWAKYRRGLLTQFKEKYPRQYQEFYGGAGK